MWDAAQACGRNLSIQNNMLFENSTKAAKELIDGGEWVNFIHARSNRFSSSRTSFCRWLRHADIRAKAQFGRRRAV
jgi:predicted dehydrogenase